MQITIVGAGPSGSWASILLARRGHSVTLIDSQAPWEKPCGGGVTAKALSSFGIFESDLPRNKVEQITIYFGDKLSVTVTPQDPIAVVSRRELGRYLLDEAGKSGVSIIKSRVTRIEQERRGWVLRTRDTSLQSDFLIGADGASSLVRRSVSSGLPPEDLSVTLGYFIPGKFQPHMKIYFVQGFEGYIWSFPRDNHTSYGLITRSEPGWTSRAKMLLSNFIAADLGTEILEQAEFYSAPVPCLGPQAWKKNRISGAGWALLGDAAGLVDPITGEGIYYAFQSAQILADTIEEPGQYEAKVGATIGRELTRAGRMYKRFYRGRFLGGDFKKRTVQFSRRSRTLRGILGNLIAGNQSYLSLKKKLVFSLPAISIDLITGRGAG
ncbi:MAG TPA: NAD(P)/FAD-dependent oxidoreductase [Terriglobia bacterium]|jgi:geranylgeranyl reductase family protein